MSRLHFHSPSGEAELAGSEYYWLNHLSEGPGNAAWNIDSSAVNRLEKIAAILALVPEGRDEGFRKQLLKAQAEDEANKLVYKAWKPGTPLGYDTDHTAQDYLISTFKTHLAVHGLPVVVAGVELLTSNLEANTALVAGSDPVRLAAKLFHWGAKHAYIEGPDRAWAADIIDEGLRVGMYRRGMWYVDRPCDGLAADQPDRKWAEQGWEQVQAFLRERDDEPVVTSHSVDDGFPNSHIAGWQPAPMPDGWMPDWVESDKGRAEWLRDYPDEDSRRQCYREGAHDRWYDIPDDEKWTMAMDGLRNDRDWARLSPDTLASVTFGIAVTVYDLLAPGRDERVRAAADADD